MNDFMKVILKDKVALIAVILAICSMMINPDISQYKTFINTKVILVMFGLMLAVSMMKEQYLFSMIAVKMVRHLKDVRTIAFAIILSTFILGMLLTNDAVLLTLVPFTLFVMSKIGRHKEALAIVVLQTIAANLGAALTPMGDPQNIYLYTNYDLSFFTFMSRTSVITGTGLVLLIVSIFMVFKKDIVSPVVEDIKIKDNRIIIAFLIFILTVLTIFDGLNMYLVLGINIVLATIFSRNSFKMVDYHLLITFVAFFIFTGNLTTWAPIYDFFDQLLISGEHTFYSGILLSQIISNVPATVLLAPFTPKAYLYDLLQGVNIGALGSIIGSLASLITFKFVISLYPEKVKSYLISYSLFSLVFMAVIIMMTYII